MIAALAMLAVVGTPRRSHAGVSSVPPVAPWDRVENVQLGGLDRHFIVHVPPTFDAQT